MVNVHKARNAGVAFTCETGQFLVSKGASGHRCMLFHLRGGAWCHQILLLARLAISGSFTWVLRTCTELGTKGLGHDPCR